MPVVPPPPQPFSGQNIPGTTEKSYPTPSTDVQLVTVLESNVCDYVAQLYGTPPPQNSDPTFLLVNEMPIDWAHVKRTYVTDRNNEDTYNASENFSGDDIGYPIFVRDYIVRRANYVPRTIATALSGLVNATVTAGGSGYTSAAIVTLTGGTGSGGAVTPIISNGVVTHLAITLEGNYTVAPTITISDTGGGTGATGTVFVQPSTAILVKEQMLRQQDSPLDGLYVLVRRIYETLPGPWHYYAKNDSVLGPVSGKERPILSAGQVSSITDTTRTTYEPRGDSSVVFMEVVETNLTPGQPLAAQRYLPQWDVIERYTAQVVGYTGASGELHLTGFEGNAGVEITPVDEGAARIEIPDLDALRAALLAIHHSWQTRISVALPNVLTAVTVVWNENYGEGSDSHPASRISGVASGSALLTVSASPSATAQSSATLMPDVQTVIKYYSESGRSLQATNYTFFLFGSATEADILTKLATLIGGSPDLQFLPVFIPQSHVLTCMGQQVSIKQNADSRLSLTSNAENEAASAESGNGGQVDTGATVRPMVIPPTIHGDITLSDYSMSRTVTTSVDASCPVIASSTGAAIGPISNAPSGLSLTAVGLVTPHTLASTTPTTVPSSGLYVPETNIALADYGLLLVHAAVVDMSQLCNILAAGTLSPNIAGKFTNAGLAGGRGYYIRLVSGTTYYLWFDGSFWNVTAGSITIGTDYWQNTAMGGTLPDGTYNPHGAYTGTLTITAIIA